MKIQIQLFHYNSLLLIPLDLAFSVELQYQHKYLDRIYISEPTPCGQSLSKERSADEKPLAHLNSVTN